ncbi:DUF4038 domain-containing protein [Paenibacillus sp. GCM10027626]|uniref:apiosidase-like domain-containing protein n=1 Tax=Paenibacillus sp. GCM10027626 TaxID=3273411 RepID=UPI00363A998C
MKAEAGRDGNAQGVQNRVIELQFQSEKSYADPFHDVQLAMKVSGEGQERLYPGFWDGGNVWKIRFSSAEAGRYRYETVCSDEENSVLHHRTGEIEIAPYEGDNPLYRHGAIRKSADSRYMEHADGTPFFWLADTWWMGLTKRLSWPDHFMELAADRVDKGFSVIQIVAGLYPDMEPFDERGANEAGFPWDKDYTSINPSYFHKMDEKMFALADCGLLPCLVGCWGFHLGIAGEEVIKRHWRYLLARYGALPIVWCVAGEAIMPFYNNPAVGKPDEMARFEAAARSSWTEIARMIAREDPYGRLLTIHPTKYGHEMVDDSALLDLNMLQTGHSSFTSIPDTVRMIRETVAREPRLPVINSEVCYEGIGGSSYHDVQRFLFWSCVLSGACGHSYGANGIWQINGLDEPYGKSPYGKSWGDTSWREASQLLGSLHVGLGKKLLERLEWWRFEPHPEWLGNHADEERIIAPYAAGIPGESRVIFLPFLEGLLWGGVIIHHMEPDITYTAYYYDPITGRRYDLGQAAANEEGKWRSGSTPAFQDWVLVLERTASGS